jgi:hypothetical protein
MDWIESSVATILTAVEGPLYDLGVLSRRGMLPGLNNLAAASVFDRLSLLKRHNHRDAHIYFRADGFDLCAVVQSSPGNFRAWLKDACTLARFLGTSAAHTVARRYHADLSAADWLRFGRLPGFTNRKSKYRRPDRRFACVQLHSHSGQRYPMAEAFHHEITRLFQVRKQTRPQTRPNGRREAQDYRSGWQMFALPGHRFKSGRRLQCS